MRKDVGMKIIVAAVLLAVIVTAYVVILPSLSTTNLRLGDGIFQARVAANENDREKGLSGVTDFASNKALLMAFTSPSKWGIWMKDMKVPIDIVWLDSDKKVIYIVKGALPSESTNVTHEPKADALYVVELPAGTVDSKAINIGDTADFQLNLADVK